VLLSRFKEPLGKCVIYLGEPSPLYVSSNFILLRPKNDIDPVLLLAILKSSFLACQLHYVIRRRSLVTEMFIKDVPQLGMPDLPQTARDSLIEWGNRMIETSTQQKRPITTSANLWGDQWKAVEAQRKLSEATTAIDMIIKEFIES
jgi:hypothetical protein